MNKQTQVKHTLAHVFVFRKILILGFEYSHFFSYLPSLFAFCVLKCLYRCFSIEDGEKRIPEKRIRRRLQ